MQCKNILIGMKIHHEIEAQYVAHVFYIPQRMTIFHKVHVSQQRINKCLFLIM